MTEQIGLTQLSPEMSLLTIEEVIQDLCEVSSSPSVTMMPSYNESDTLEEKVQKSFQALRRTIKLKNRKEALINAYFLGLLFNNAVSFMVKF